MSGHRIVGSTGVIRPPKPGGGGAFSGAKLQAFTTSPGFVVHNGPVPFGSLGSTIDAVLWDSDGYTSSGSFVIPSGLGGRYLVTIQGQVDVGIDAVLTASDGINLDSATQLYILHNTPQMGGDVVNLRAGVTYALSNSTGADINFDLLSFSILRVGPPP